MAATALLEVEGPGCESFVNEAGGHRVQRVPEGERRGRVHSSTVTVAVLPGDGEAGGGRRPDSDFRVEWFRGSGAGGQHRNKHANSARVVHVPSGLRRERQGRSREANLREARAALEADLDALEAAGSAARENGRRSAQVGTGMRADKRRTWRFRDDRVTDHLTGKSGKASVLLRGRMDSLWGGRGSAPGKPGISSAVP